MSDGRCCAMIGFEPHLPGCKHFEQAPWDEYQEQVRNAGSYEATVVTARTPPASETPPEGHPEVA